MHPGRSSRSVTHPEIAPGQARLTLEFFRDRLPKKKLQLVDMSILSILLSPWAGVSHLVEILVKVNLGVYFLLIKKPPSSNSSRLIEFF